jgi:hypothetical protein
MPLDDTVNQQLALLATHRRTLAHLLAQAAQYGGEVFAPPATANGIAQARAEIQRIKAALRAGGVVVEDELNELLPVAGAGPARLTPHQQRNRSRMLDRVETFWVSSVLEQSLSQVARVELGLQHAPNQVAHPWDTIVQRHAHPARAVAAGTPAIELFDEVGGALLILGAPGAGKTTLLLELARDLIARARREESQPIPVVFNLSTWAERQQPLQEWLVEELNQRYDVPGTLAHEWVEADAVLPLLDGLDEVRPEARDDCIAAINAYRQVRGFVSLAVCSRIADYEQLEAQLRLQGAVVVEPLTRQQIDSYFEQAGHPLATVRTALRDDPELWELIDTPLMLSIVAQTYKDASPTRLRASGTVEERWRQLFDDYIAAMFQRRSKPTDYPQQLTLRWLCWLARGMTRQAQTVFLVERLQPLWLATPAARLQYALLDRGLAGLAGGLIGVLALGVADVLLGGWISWVLLGLLFGLVALFFGGQTGIEMLQQRPTWRTIADALVGVLAGGLSGLLVGGLVGGLGGVLVGVLIGGLLGALLGVLTGKPGVSVRQVFVIEQLRWVWSKAWRSALSGLVFGLAYGLAHGLAYGLIARLVGHMLVAGPGGVLVMGLSVWLGGAPSAILFGKPGGLLVGALVFGLVFGLVGGVSGGPLTATIQVNQGIQRSARTALAFGLAGALVGVLVVGLGGMLGGFIVGPSSFLVVVFVGALVFGLIFGLGGALSFGGYACLSHLALRLILSRSGSLPLRLVPFLDDCVERIFLRKVGGGYIFVHRLLMEHFASLYDGPRAEHS